MEAKKKADLEAIKGLIDSSDLKVADLANDNVENSLAFLRKAINAPDKDEVLGMVQQTIMEFQPWNRIELKVLDKVERLTEEPRHFLFPKILETINADIPIALIGPAGSGKSTVVEQAARALGMKFYMQNSVTGDHQLTGYMDAYGKYHTTPFRTAFEKGGVLFVDEVDTSDPSSLKWMNTAIANKVAVFPDSEEPISAHKDFRIVIAANTFGNGADRIYVGANQLDASTLDRFVFFDFRYDEKLESLLAGNMEWSKRVQQIRKGALKCKARMVVSPRASINGAKLLALGWDKKAVEQQTVWKNCDDDTRARIEKEAA